MTAKQPFEPIADTPATPEPPTRCPSCNSPKPQLHKHPTHICQDPFHGEYRLPTGVQVTECSAAPIVSHAFPPASQPASPYSHECKLASPLGDGFLRVAITETEPDRYWVIVNFPNRSSLTLCMNVDFLTASDLFKTARQLGAEALAYAAEVSKAGAR